VITNLYFNVTFIARTNSNSPKIPTTIAGAIVREAVFPGCLYPKIDND
jgi:hypothetical protein